jgi:hypothetical protein
VVRRGEERRGENSRGEERRGEERRGEERTGEERTGEERTGEERRSLQCRAVRYPCISVSVLLIQLKLESSSGVSLPPKEHSFPSPIMLYTLHSLLFCTRS